MRSLVEMFEESAKRQREKTAFIVRSGRISYGRLEAEANRVARRIAEVDGTANRPAAALLEESVATAVAMLGILKAGKAYVPLNAAHPEARLRFMLDESEARVIVTDAAHAAIAAALAGGRAVVDIGNLPEGTSDAPLGLAFNPDDLACILYTSGSTGEPKGVYNDHRQFYPTVMTSREGVGLRESDVFLLFGSFSASGPARATLWGLIKGATVRAGLAEDLARIPEVLTEEGITLANMGPSILTRFLESHDGRAYPALRQVYTAGEPFPRALLKRFFDAFPSGVQITNGFGLSETGPACNYYMTGMPEFEGDLVPIGTPVEGTRVMLLDAQMRPVERGEVGQIAVVSPGTAFGYWKKPELTKERFVTDPASGERMCLSGDMGRMLADGSLVHLGRQDNVVKVRGWNVDLTEVETAMRAHPSVSDAAAAVVGGETGARSSGWSVTSRKGRGAGIAAGEMRKWLAGRLPEYMVPAAFVTLERLPMTVTGKLDRKALPKVEGKREEVATPYAAPRGPVEEALARIFAEALGVDRVGIDDDFLELGGHSLSAARVVAGAVKAFGVEIAMREFFALPTVAGAAAMVVERMAARAMEEGEELGELEEG